MKCEICGKDFSIKGLTHHLRTHKIKLKDYYDKYLKKEKEGICPVCGKNTTLRSLSHGYSEYCSATCVSRCDKTKEKRIEFLKSQPKEYHDKIIEKRKNTSIERFGKDNIFKTEIFKDKRKKTSLKKYGTEFPQQSNKVKEKTLKTMIKNHGVLYPMHIDSAKEKVVLSMYKKNLPKVKKFLKSIDLELLSEYKNNEDILKIRCTKCDGVYYKSYANIQQGSHPCFKCNPIITGSSKDEKEILDFIKTIYNGEIIENNRTLLYPKELDIVIPDLKLAIEYNGLYWHSEDCGIPKLYHINKTNKCMKHSYNLIHIFEDEWIFKKEIVKSRIRNLFKVNNNKIYARNCIIKEIDTKLKNDFLNENHLQGEDISKIRLGAFNNNILVSVMTFSCGNISKGSRKKDEIWELNRFCSKLNYTIPGIASKLLTYFKRNYKWKEIYSYADRRWSNGNIYEKIGFTLDNITEPNYWYIKGYNRIHRFKLRKRNDEPKEIPEWYLRKKEGYIKIWDCGNLKFKLTNT